MLLVLLILMVATEGIVLSYTLYWTVLPIQCPLYAFNINKSKDSYYWDYLS